MKTNELKRTLGALSAFKELSESPRFGRRANVDMFSFFEELVRKPALRSYFGWDNEEKKFVDPAQRELLFRLIIGEGAKRPKIATGLEFRSIARILDIPEARASLEDLNQPLQRALDLASAREQRTWFSNLLERLELATDDLLQVSGVTPTNRQRELVKAVITKLEAILKTK
jgi:hypothetical protein